MPEFENYQPPKEEVSICWKRNMIADQYPDIDLLFMDPPDYDEAIIGVAESVGSKLAIAYDFDKVIEINMKLADSNYEDAVEWYEYNQVGSYVGEHTPIFVHK